MCDNILATENQQAIINDVIEVKISVYLYENQTKIVKTNEEHAEYAHLNNCRNMVIFYFYYYLCIKNIK